jgi:hypothetical protein
MNIAQIKAALFVILLHRCKNFNIPLESLGIYPYVICDN